MFSINLVTCMYMYMCVAAPWWWVGRIFSESPLKGAEIFTCIKCTCTRHGVGTIGKFEEKLRKKFHVPLICMCTLFYFILFLVIMSEDTPSTYTEEEYERNVVAIKEMKITENEDEIRRILRQTSNDVEVRRERERERERERVNNI